MNVTSTASIRVQGRLTAGALGEFVAAVPKDAAISITETRGDQRDPGYFTITAAWSGAAR